jgi:hypothetical protein
MRELEIQTTDLNFIYETYNNLTNTISPTLIKHFSLLSKNFTDVINVTRHQTALNRQFLARIETFVQDKVSDIDDKMIIMFGLMVFQIFILFCILLYSIIK